MIIVYSIGLNDKDTKEYNPKNRKLVLRLADVYLKNYTVTDCNGVFTHNNGVTIKEKSLAIKTIADNINKEFIDSVKFICNQESVMVEEFEPIIKFL